MEKNNNSELMTIKELSEYLKIRAVTIYDKIHKGEIPFIKISHRTIRFRKADIDEWLQSKRVETIKDKK